MSKSEAAWELDQLDAIRRRVLNVVGHALRTPVTTLRGLADANAEADEVTRSEIAPALQRLARRVERLLDDLLVAAGVATAMPVEAAVGVPIGEELRRAWAELGQHDGLTITGAAGAVVSAAPEAPVRILTHLLDNALKYGHGPVAVSLEEVEGRVRLTVDRAGPDLPPSDAAYAFEPFYRGEAAVVAASGLGVGLTVARALAEQAGGSVTLQARPGGGVIARLDLRAHRP